MKRVTWRRKAKERQEMADNGEHGEVDAKSRGKEGRYTGNKREKSVRMRGSDNAKTRI
jgi:hypothetical protein